MNNACATQAILSILMNLAESTEYSIGQTLTEFRTFVAEFDPELKGMAIGEHEAIRQVHNSFGRPEQLYFDGEADQPNAEKEDPFHFVAIMPVNGQILEFDGLKQSPAIISESTEDGSWTAKALEAIQAKVSAVKSSEIRFSLMAVIQDRACALQAELAALTPETEAEGRRSELEARLAEQIARSQERRLENTLRQHNFVPLIMGLLDCMARQGKLEPL